MPVTYGLPGSELGGVRVSAKGRDAVNAAFVEAAGRLGLTAKQQTAGRPPGGRLTRANEPKDPESNPSMEGRIGSYQVFVINYGETDEKGTTWGFTRCVVETTAAMLPAGVSARLRLAGPFGENLNPIAWFMERFIGLFIGFSRRPRRRGSPQGLLASAWVQLDEIPETGFLDGYMVAGRFRWPEEAEPPPYGQPEAVMTPARTIAARKLLEGEAMKPGVAPNRSVEIDSSTLESTSRELTTSQDLVDLIEASCDLANAMLN